MIEEYSNSVLSGSYILGNSKDDVLQMTRNDNIYYYHSDHIGSTIAITDINSELVERVSYDAYGLPVIANSDGAIIPNSKVNNSILFSGREFDSEIAAYYFAGAPKKHRKLRIARFAERHSPPTT